jgi:hypothetical protein
MPCIRQQHECPYSRWVAAARAAEADARSGDTAVLRVVCPQPRLTPSTAAVLRGTEISNPLPEVDLGVPERAICAIIRDHKDKPISEKTFRKHFRKEIDIGATELNSKVGNFMVAT